MNLNLLFACWVILYAFLLSADFLNKENILFKKSPLKILSDCHANSLDPNQARLYVGPDLGPGCLQRLSAPSRKRVKSIVWPSYI